MYFVGAWSGTWLVSLWTGLCVITSHNTFSAHACMYGCMYTHTDRRTISSMLVLCVSPNVSRRSHSCLGINITIHWYLFFIDKRYADVQVLLSFILWFQNTGSRFVLKMSSCHFSVSADIIVNIITEILWGFVYFNSLFS